MSSVGRGLPPSTSKSRTQNGSFFMATIVLITSYLNLEILAVSFYVACTVDEFLHKEVVHRGIFF
jgi:hypothetical protein